jgi:hypothetical protein
LPPRSGRAWWAYQSIPPIAVIPAGMPGAADVIVIDEHAKAYRAANPAMKRTFEEAARTHNVLAECAKRMLEGAPWHAS